MDAEEERRWEEIRDENRRQDEAEYQRRRDQQEIEAYVEGVETRDYSRWYLRADLFPQEFAQGTGSGSGSYEHPVHSYVRAVRTALNGAQRVPPILRDKWLFDLGLIRPERPQNALVTVQGIICQVTDMRDALRPRRQGMDLDLSQYTATIEYDAQIRVVLDQLQQLKAYLASTAS
jgi:hypothetical protein